MMSVVILTRQSMINIKCSPYISKDRVFHIADEKCSVEDGAVFSCVIYFRCPPVVHMISNLSRPFSDELPRLMKGSLMCGRENVGGFQLPKVCCLPSLISKSKESATEKPTSTKQPNIMNPRIMTDKER